MAGFRPKSWSPAPDPTAASTPVEDPIVTALRNKAATDQVQAVRLTAKNLPDAYRAMAAASASGDEQEIAKARRNVEQASGDLNRLLGDAYRVEDETPVIGSGSGLQQVAGALGAFFVPGRQLVKHTVEHFADPKAGSRGSGGDFFRDTWDQVVHPSARQTAADVAAELWSKYGKPTMAPDRSPEIRSRADRIRAILQTPAARRADPAFVAEQRRMRADEAKAARYAEEHPQPVKTLGGVEQGTAEIGAELLEMFAPSPGSVALGATMKGAGKLAGKGLRGARNLLDKTAGGERLIDDFTYGGPLRRVDASVAGMPDQAAKWKNATDELLEMEVKTKRERHHVAERLKELFRPLSAPERTLAIDAVEHPEILSGNPNLLESLAGRGIDVTKVVSPKAARMISPTKTPEIMEQLAAVEGGAGAAAAKGPPTLEQFVSGALAGAGSARPDIRRLWPARQGLRQLHKEGRAARMSVDPRATAIDEPYIVHASDQAAERAAAQKGINIAAMGEAERAAGNRAAHGFTQKSGLRVHTEHGRDLQERLGNIALEADLEDNLEPFIEAPPDTRLGLNAAMKRLLPEGTQTNRDFFSGRVQPQAEKLVRDVEDTNVLELLQKWLSRGEDVTTKPDLASQVAGLRAQIAAREAGLPVPPMPPKRKIQTADQMTAAPGGVGPMAVPQTPAWARVSGDRKVAVPIPVAEAVEKLNPLGGRGFYDTAVDAVTGRSPAAARIAGKGYSALSELFKIPATVMNPRYYIRNWGGNYDQMYKEFGPKAFDPDVGRLVDELIGGQAGPGMGLARPVPGPSGKSTTLGEIRQRLEARGMHGDTGNPKIPVGPSIEQELADLDLSNPARTAILRALNPLKPSVNPIVQAAARKFGAGVEESARARAAILAYQRSGDLGEAVSTAEKLLFNPHRTSEAMQRLSGPFPFIRWWGKNIPLQARLVTEHPNRVYNVTTRAPELSRLAALPPEEQKESRRRPLGKYLQASPFYWTGAKDAIGQPVGIPYPFSTEGELYDMAEVASGAARDLASGNPSFPLARSRLMTALLQRGNPVLAQVLGEPNRDILRERDINFEIRDPSGEIVGHQEGTGKAGAASELAHRLAERLGWAAGKQLPVLATSRAPGSPYVMQDASTKRAMETVPLLNAFPLSTLRVFDQNSTLPALARIPAVFGSGLQPVPWYQTELNRAFQTREQITHQRKTTRQKSPR